jgi:hypothetical protein
MDNSPLLRSLELTVDTRHDLDSILDAAVAQLMPAAMAESSGIKIARSGGDQYTASVRHDIPFGAIVESWER